MIAIGLSPNTQKEDVIEAINTLVRPWTWKTGKNIAAIEEWFKKYLNSQHVISTNSGRSALLVILNAFNIGKGEEVIVQAYTCLAVPEVVKWAGAIPVFVDIDESLNIDTAKLEKSITSKTRAIIVLHTFGIPAQVEKIKKIAHKYNLILIEDCAHALGATMQGRKIGTFGDASFFSFGRDKVVSSVFGGLATLTKIPANSLVLKNWEEEKENLEYPGQFWIFQQLLHPVISLLVLAFYDFGIGKALLLVLQKLHLLSFPIYQEEKEGKMPTVFPKKYPNALASLLMVQLKKIDNLNTHRTSLAKEYFKKLKGIKNITLPQNREGSIYLRFNILVNAPEKTRTLAKQNGFILGNWYHDTIDPKNTKQIVGYKSGSCPNAEKMASLSLNLPTHSKMNINNVPRLIALLKSNI